MTTKVSVVNEHSTSFMGGIWDIRPKKYACWDFISQYFTHTTELLFQAWEIFLQCLCSVPT